MKKYLLITPILVASFTVAFAQTPTIEQYLSTVVPKPSEITLDSPENSASSTDGEYKGRNKRVVEALEYNKVNMSSGLARSVTMLNAKSTVKYDILESTTGEFIDKLETDRLKFTQTEKDKYDELHTNLSEHYEEAKKIQPQNLGSEVDPLVQPAFKCKDLNNCDNKSNSDGHAIVNCNSEERLHWSGKKWKCVDLLKYPPVEGCDAQRQYSISKNGGYACVNYIFVWVKESTTECEEGQRQIIYRCMAKKSYSDTGFAVSTSIEEDRCVGGNPSTKESC